MNNLFLREKESWLIWLIWGMFAAVAVFITATNTHQLSYLIALKLGIFSLLTWYMTYSKRFSFWRAMKISFVVYLIAAAPMLFLNVETVEYFANHDVFMKVGLLIAVGLIFSVICSLIARQPKEYY